MAKTNVAKMIESFRYYPVESVFVVLTRDNKSYVDRQKITKQVLVKTDGLPQLDNLQEMIGQLWGKGYMIRTVTWANSEWIVVADDAEDKKLQHLFVSTDKPEKEINEAIANNRPIHFIGFCHSHWVLLVEQKPAQETVIQKLKIFPEDIDIVTECEQIWEEGLVVSHLARGSGSWILIATQNPNFFMHWVQEATLLKRYNWNKQLLDNSGTSDPNKIKNLHILELGEDRGIMINWVLNLPKNVAWNVPSILLSQTMPLSKWNELGGRHYKDGEFYVQKS